MLGKVGYLAVFLSFCSACGENISNPYSPSSIIPQLAEPVSFNSTSPKTCWPFTQTDVLVEVGDARLATFRYDFKAEPGLEAVLKIRWHRWMQEKRYPLTMPAEGSVRYRYETSGTKYIQYSLNVRHEPEMGCKGAETITIDEVDDPFRPEPPPPIGCTSCEQANPLLTLSSLAGFKATFEYTAECGYVYLHTGSMIAPTLGPLIPRKGLIDFQYALQPVCTERGARLAVVLDDGSTCFSERVAVLLPQMPQEEPCILKKRTREGE
jgi:hypothetical protein